MIKKLRRKFVRIAMLSVLAVVLTVAVGINGANALRIRQREDGLLNLLSRNEGRFPSPPDKKDPPGGKPGFEMTPETPYETRYFLVTLNDSGAVARIDTSHIAAVTSEGALAYAEAVAASGKISGTRGNYRYQVTETSGGRLIVFLDCSTQRQSALAMLIVSLCISAGCLLIVFVLVSVFSKRAIRPVVEGMEKQRQFITDAGHELKTPLAVISADTDVFELTAGQNEWLDSIRNQINRMNGLVRELLALAKLDEGGPHPAFQTVDFSRAVQQTAESFEAPVHLRGLHLSLQVAPELKLTGDEQSLTELVAILMDNAVKYTDDGGRIELSLRKNGRQIQLSVENTCQGVPQEPERLFDRFYRADAARSRESGGYGLGLSIARAIAEQHGGRMEVHTSEGSRIRFTATFPGKENKPKA